MDNEKKIIGYHPGELCEERTQWIFRGEWTPEMMQPLFDVIIPHIENNRKNYGFDVTNYFEFDWSDITDDLRVYYASRRTWGFLLQGFTIQELAGKLQEKLSR